MFALWGKPFRMSNTNQSEQRWVLVLAVGLVISSFALSWLSRSGNCFDSNWISAIEVQDGEKSTTVYACKTKRSAPFDTWTYEHLTDIAFRIKSVERVLTDLEIKTRPLGSIKISAAELEKSWPLERLIVNRALWGNVQDPEIGSALAKVC